MALYEVALGERMRFTPSEVVTRGLPVTALDSVKLAPSIVVNYGLVVAEQLRVGSIVAPQWFAGVTIADSVNLVAALHQARDVSVTEQAEFVFALELQRAISVAEGLTLSHALQVNGSYRLTIHQAMRLTSRLLRWFGADIADGMQLDDDLFGRALAIAGVQEAIGIGAAVAPQLLLHVAARDDFALTHEGVAQLLLYPHLREGFTIEAGYIGPDGSFTTWAMNTRTGAVTEYADFTFNSFGRAGNRYLGASADGLYELVGDDDDGEEIVARIKSGFLQFGGTQLSRLKAAYIAARGEGEMVLKIVEGSGKTYVYRADTRNMRSTKVHMGKGQKSRYFAFELISKGQDFDLDTIEFVPIVVPRRV